MARHSPWFPRQLLLLSLPLVLGATPAQRPWPGEGDTVYVAGSFKVREYERRGQLVEQVVAPCQPFVLLRADPKLSRWIAQAPAPLDWKVQLEGPWLPRMHGTRMDCDAQFAALGEPAGNASNWGRRLVYFEWLADSFAVPQYFGPARQVKTGMTYDQTRAIMGPPLRTVSFLGVVEWCYCAERSPDRLLVFYFDSGRVVAQEDFTIDWTEVGDCAWMSRPSSLPFGIYSDNKPPKKVRTLWLSRAPRVIVISGPTLDRQVILNDWNDNGTLMLALAAPIVPAPGRLESRPSYNVALFWGERWVRYGLEVRHWANDVFDLELASQHGRFYPAIGSARALFVFDEEGGPQGEAARAAGRFRAVGQDGLGLFTKAGLRVSVQ